jgi:DNA-binding Lrp family transcriptional regulator
MGAKRPPACQRQAYVPIDLELLEATGEIKIVGAPIIAPTVTTKVPRGKFEITYTAELFDIMRELGNKKIEVLSYILDHKDGNNSLNMTNSQLAEELNVSRPTVIDTLKILSNAELVKRKGTVIMVSPNLMVKGNQLREAWLMRKYEEIPDTKQIPEDVVADLQIDPQLSFDSDGKIYEKAK